MKRWIVAVALAVFLAPALSASSSAETVVLIGFEDPTLRADVNFNYTTTGVITVSITNNSSILENPDARLTAFGFNLPEEVSVVGFNHAPSPPAVVWNAIVQSNAIDTPGKFGFYDVAAITGTNFNGGYPEFGIPPGATFTFQFTLSGSSLHSLTEASFLGLGSYSQPRRPAEYEQYFIGRFQRTGLDGEGSDVAIPEPEDPQNPEDPV